MATEQTWRVTESVSFEDAIAFTQRLLGAIDAGQIDDEMITAAVASLVATSAGARGFFVVYLTSELAIADVPSAAIVGGLLGAPEVVSDLLVKNVAMSAAMAVHHRRNGDLTTARASDRVCRRSQDAIARLQLPRASERAHQLARSAATGEGNYTAFLRRYGYDAEQLQAIQQALAATAPAAN
ncbi:hypothetical protein KR51_00009560 [Rubidibacter lacunae KORDI 51-2]|uniref:Uncharacterized protein n=1 Tax=Rubidibacter lacunae KORDI 51-2 TaxID=582515 RepID=U5DRP7_9CHRO|nr:hypothetical protein [Rubidibacter lacunae]ERN42365.1 hypothetical protein KR51_00009560 [Rubidibacter lacunae KORDI 51-2]